jgi:hypothetical protein
MSWWKKIIELILKLFPKPDPQPQPEPDKYPDAIDVKEITWLGVNVGEWEKKYTLRVYVEGSRIVYDQQGTTDWDPKPEAGKPDMTGNPWIIAKLNGQWTAATHEWMTKGQKAKAKRSVHGDHIKKSEFGNDWTPTVGEEYGFLVSGLCRGSQRNQSERTQIILYTWTASRVMELAPRSIED